jgi:beta-N-acetylhexosaminidase
LPKSIPFRHLLLPLSLCLGLAQPNLAAAEPSLDLMIGQMIIVGFTGTKPDDAGVKAVQAQLAQGVIGGIILLDRNVTNPAQLTRLTAALNPPSLPIPAFISVDQEGGRVQRLPADKGFTPWDSAANLRKAARKGDPDFTLTYYSSRAQELHALGVNLNFAPVVDLNLNPANPIIGKLGRSFAPDPATVSDMAAAFIRAHRSAGVLTSVKHFPGHGSSLGDSHKALPSIATTWRDAELIPFQTLADEGLIDLAMIGHLYHPDFSDAKDRPSSISRKGVAALRRIVGEAVILTDDLQMQAIQDSFGDAEAAVQAVIAGDDLLLFLTYKHPDPQIGPKINRAILQAVHEGRIDPAQIEASYARILKLKQRL